ncbi:hypothetical protein K0M31_008007 [Melipona bicolor]|uniref:Uncharacterized protein n=1 Tax=Melipona bicolor TaxID=60889 RepID=A0AA40GCR2_9HYME|nr:hypothetical protein K0M31_008007 [Melipona bicolor]
MRASVAGTGARQKQIAGQSIVGGRARQRFRGVATWQTRRNNGKSKAAPRRHTRGTRSPGNRVCDLLLAIPPDQELLRGTSSRCRHPGGCEWEDDKTAAKQRGRNPERIRTSDPWSEHRGEEDEGERDDRRQVEAADRYSEKVRSSGHRDNGRGWWP